MILWMTGPPGSGKTTVGRMLAAATDRFFIDLDEMIARSSGMSVSELITTSGEEEFRRQETACLATIVDHPEHRRRTVVATGGGTVLSHFNRDMMRSSGVRILLEADPETILGRISEDDVRPLIGPSPGTEQINRLLQRREIPYADHDLSVDATEDPDRIVRVIRARLRGARRAAWRMKKSLREEDTRISLFDSPWGGISRVARRTRGAKVCVLSDENVAVYYAQTLRTLAGPDGVIYIVEPGEQSKSLVVAERIVERLAREGFTREDTIVSFGGGMVTDLGGFLASIYMRGIHHFAMPTSLLAMVDASVGGKTAVNAAGVRNLVGTFRQPDEVVIVPSFLRTLPEREFRSGLVESMKMGMTGSNLLRKTVREVAESCRHGSISPQTGKLIRLSVEEKFGVIAEDVEDHDRRRILNFGHTVAHALEGVCPGEWTHGEAVAVGIVAETEIALRGKIAPVEQKRGEKIIEDILPFTVPHPVRFPDVDQILRAMGGDKKVGPDGVRMVVPSGVDGWRLDRVANPVEIESSLVSAWNRIERYHHKERGEGK